jgi:hypothetical protein
MRIRVSAGMARPPTWDRARACAGAASVAPATTAAGGAASRGMTGIGGCRTIPPPARPGAGWARAETG